MNRSAMGAEAFVSYNGQNDTRFFVFDWARNDHWQVDVPLSGLADYLGVKSAHGHPYQVMTVWNTTWLVSGSTWRNQALLYNRPRNGWDLAYEYDYSATDAQQRTGFTGSWAGVIETFQPLYTGTNAMGALNMEVASADAAGNWGSPALLAASNSTVRVDNVGFRLLFLDANHSFVAIS
jgi:hypothetical protein